MHSEHSEGTQPPPLPKRAINQEMPAALPLWGESECCDRATIELCLEGLRALETPPAMPTVQDEVDGVIARWRAQQESGLEQRTHCRDSRRRQLGGQ